MTHVALFGLGIMGSAMGQHLLAAGLPVTGYDPDAGRAREFTAAGGTVATSAAAAASADVVITSLPSPAAVREAGSVLARHARPGTVVAETSTMPLTVKEECRALLAEAEVILLDCPLSGTGLQARTRDLVVYGSGDPSAFETARPVLQAFSRSVRYLGPFGTGSVMKFVANLLVAVHSAVTAEAFALGIRAGLDRGVLWDTIRDGAGNSVIFDKRGRLMIDEEYMPATAKMSMFVKDVGIIRSFAQDLGSATPLLDAAAALYDQGMQAGLADADAAALLTVLEAAQRPAAEGGPGHRGPGARDD
jgi:putative dehydrogenase